MKNNLILTGALVALCACMLFSGCTGSSRADDEGAASPIPDTGDASVNEEGVLPSETDDPLLSTDVERTMPPSRDGNVQSPLDNESPIPGNAGQQSGNPLSPGNQSGPGPRDRTGKDPMNACSGKSAGDTCTITFGNQSVDGTCTDRNGNITCRPKDMGAGPGGNMQGPGTPGGMDEGSVQACSGKTAGATCTITMGDRTMDGTCTDRSGTISCVPGNMGPQGNGRDAPAEDLPMNP